HRRGLPLYRPASARMQRKVAREGGEGGAELCRLLFRRHRGVTLEELVDVRLQTSSPDPLRSSPCRGISRLLSSERRQRMLEKPARELAARRNEVPSATPHRSDTSE